MGDAPPPPARPRVLLGVCGSVAAVKARELAAALAVFVDVRIILTPAAEHFWALGPGYDPAAARRFDALAPPVPVLRDADEWAGYAVVKRDPVLHIELRRWADVLLIAPLSANTLAKLAHGHADGLLTCVARAWDFRARKPLLVAPAMNTAMWEHPATAPQLATLAAWGAAVVPPVAGVLACGDTGCGALAAVADIAAAVALAAAAPVAVAPVAVAPEAGPPVAGGGAASEALGATSHQDASKLAHVTHTHACWGALPH